MKWIEIKSENDLPKEGKYVLGRHNRNTWSDRDDQDNVNCVVVKMVKGLSLNDRELMKEGKLPSIKEAGVHYDGSWDKPIYTESHRYNVYRSEDEHGNNTVAYNWQMFGSDSFLGQSITHWTPITKTH